MSSKPYVRIKWSLMLQVIRRAAQSSWETASIGAKKVNITVLFLVMCSGYLTWHGIATLNTTWETQTRRPLENVV